MPQMGGVPNHHHTLDHHSPHPAERRSQGSTFTYGIFWQEGPASMNLLPNAAGQVGALDTLALSSPATELSSIPRLLKGKEPGIIGSAERRLSSCNLTAGSPQTPSNRAAPDFRRLWASRPPQPTRAGGAESRWLH